MTAAELIAQAAKRLSDAGVPEPELDAKILFLEAFHMDQVHFLMNRMRPLTEEQRAQQETYEVMIDRRSARVPLQQILGSQEFMGLTFRVTPDVLIPRQDTETLVEEALKHLGNVEKPEILDMCTGSGCILLSLLLELPQALGTGVDVSEGALCVAKENRKRLGLEQRAELIQSDLFSADYFRKNSGNDHMEYDMLISNPPYIRTEDIEGLMEEVRFHDPVLALDGKENGLYFYEKITEQAGRYLEPGGWLMYEIGCDQGMDVSEIMKKNGFEQIEIKKDLAGLDRVVTGRKMQEEQNV